ncbi:MAG: RNA polymerase sigma factor [Planctomycetes bacterium]|nr:RNA polymerase sigma factor [Planctomycetota bacterium]
MNEPRTSDPIDELLRRGYRYALSLTHDPTLSEDLLQEACLRISRRSGPWHAAYLFKTIRNLRIDASRLGARQPVEPLVGDGPRAPTPDEPEWGADELAGALAQLRPEDREMLFLTAVEGYTTAEIAQLTGRPRGTILSALHRAKKKLRQLLADDEEEGLT